MEIIVAKTAGYCFGVDKAVKDVEKLCRTNHKVATYGPLIHNPTVIRDLQEKGVVSFQDLDAIRQLPADTTIVIRSHGVAEKEFLQIQASGNPVSDSTCPYVKKIHRIVRKFSEQGYKIIILGDPTHPEVKGISGWARTEVICINQLAEIEQKQNQFNQTDDYCLVAQTTFNTILYKDILNKLQKMNIRVIINDTICNATTDRQTEAIALAQRCTKMIVIGGKNSSNSRKLFEICAQYCKDSFFIESIEDLVLNVFTVNDIIGITAGASTPKKIIEEVISNVRNVEF